MSRFTRRSSLLAVLCSCALAPAASVAGSGCADQPVRLTAVWYDVVEVFPDGGAGAAEELRRRFCEIGINTDWRRARPGDLYGVGPQLEVPVAILGAHPFQSRVRRPVMGEVPQEWSSPGPRPVRVYVEGIRAALGLERFGASSEMLMRLAVGRVATHEMVHSLVPGQAHSRVGLMSSHLGRAALVGTAPPMTALYVSGVRAALRIGARPASVDVAGRVRVAPLYGGETRSEGPIS